MNCEELQHFLLEHPQEALPEDARRHLSSCAECRAYAEILATTEAPSRDLEARVLSACHAELRHRRPFFLARRSTWLAMAAALALLALLSVRFLPSGRESAHKHYARNLAAVEPLAAFDAEIAFAEAEMDTLETQLQLVASGF